MLLVLSLVLDIADALSFVRLKWISVRVAIRVRVSEPVQIFAFVLLQKLLLLHDLDEWRLRRWHLSLLADFWTLLMQTFGIIFAVLKLI